MDSMRQVLGRVEAPNIKSNVGVRLTHCKISDEGKSSIWRNFRSDVGLSTETLVRRKVFLCHKY